MEMTPMGKLEPFLNKAMYRNGLVSRFTGKLGNKLAAWFLIVALIPLLLTSLYLFQFSSKQLVDKQTESYVKLVSSTSLIMNQWLTERMSQMDILSLTTDIRSTDQAAKAEFIGQFTKSANVFDGNTYIGPDGIVVADTFPDSVGIDLSERPFFQDGLKGKSSYTDVILAKTTGKRSIIVASPVKGKEENVVGVLTGLINFEAFTDRFLKDLYIDNGAVYPIVVDNRGQIQLHPNKEWIGKKVSELELASDLGGILQKQEKEAASYHYADSGESYVVAYSPIQATGYGLYLHIPESSITSAVSSMKINVTVIMLFVTILVMIIAIILSRSITRPIAKVAVVAEQVSIGELTVEPLAVRSKDEVGMLSQAVNKMVEQLRNFIMEINATAQQVAVSAEELSANAEHTSKATEHIAVTIQEVADGTEQQVRNVENSVQSIHDVSVGVQQIALNARQVADSAGNASDSAQEGHQSMESMTKQMGAIHDTVQQLAEIVKRLGQRSAEIDNIAQVIHGVASQTNLLALNASIEAARAGEQGRGFAVVAGEVKNLSEQTAQSAQQIATLIDAIQSETNQAVQSMEQGTKEVAVGIDVVQQAGDYFEQILQAIRQVADQIQNVSVYAHQMSQDTDQAVNRVQQITAVAEQSAEGTQNVSAATEEQLAAMEQVSSSSTALAQMAEDLQEHVARFKV